MPLSQWENRAERTPVRFLIALGLVVCLLIAIFGVIGHVFGWFGEAAKTSQDQFGPKASLVKYEWFIDASNGLEAKLRDISVYEVRMKSIEDQYREVARKDWPRHDAEAYNVALAELAGIKASYNSLVREYNSNSTKFNWSYVNTQGNVPRTYQEK